VGERRGKRVILWLAVGIVVAAEGGTAFARCTQSGNSTFCVDSDGSFEKTTRVGNATFVDRSDGYHETTTRAGSNTFSSDSNGNFAATYRMGDHSFETGVNANSGSSWSRSRTEAGNDTFASGTVDGQPWSATKQTTGSTTVFTGVNTAGEPWRTNSPIVGNTVLYGGVDSNGFPSAQLQPQPQPAQPVFSGNAQMMPVAAGLPTLPAAPMQSFCPIC
jgi:hypothetical protein